MSPDGLPLIARAVGLRALRFGAVLVGTVVLVEGLMWAAPGDPIDLIPNGAELRGALAAEWGLDRPLPARIADRLLGLLRGDLGESLIVRPGAAVADLAAAAAARSALVLLPALALSIASALVLSLARRGARLVQLVSAAPVFLLAWASVTGINAAVFSLMTAGWIGRPAWFALPLTDAPARTAVAVAALAVGSGALSEAHTDLSDALGRLRRGPLVQGLLARGTPPGRHLISNLLAPVAALAADRLAFLLGGLVVVETVMLHNGAGALLWQAALNRDYPLAIGLAVTAAVTVTFGRLLADLAQIVADPRLRAEP